MKHTPTQLAERFKRAVTQRSLWEDEWEDAYRYAFPSRASWYHEEAGENRSRQIFDETAVEATQEFASSMAFGLTPSFARWFRLEPGPLAAARMDESQRRKVQQALDEVSAYVFAAIDSSDFQPANHELFLDIALGWSNMWVDLSDDPAKSLDFRTLPQTQMFIDLGPGAVPDGRFRRYLMTPEGFRATYGPRAKRLEAPETEQINGQVAVVDAVYRDWDERGDEVWHRAVFKEKAPRDGFLFEKEYRGYGSSPMVTARWSTTSFEAYGRGPLYNVLPAIRTANLVTQYTLENAEMAIVGMWQSDDDSVINLNALNLLPGTVIPRDPESRGLEPLQSAGRFDVSNLILENMHTAIRRALFNVDLGPTNKTPMSATEAAERQSQLARRIGAPYARLLSEYVSPMIRRVVRVLVDAGKIELPKVDGRNIQVVSRSPLARAQRQESVTQFLQYDQMLKSVFGEMSITSLNEEAVTNWLADQLEVDARLLAEAEARDAARQQIAQAQQAQAAGPGEPGPGGGGVV